MLLSNDGVANGKQIVPQNGCAKPPAAPGYPHLKPGVDHPYFGLRLPILGVPGSKRRFALQERVDKQSLVDPELRLVMVQAADGRVLYIQNPRRGVMHYGGGIVANIRGVG